MSIYDDEYEENANLLPIVLKIQVLYLILLAIWNLINLKKYYGGSTKPTLIPGHPVFHLCVAVYYVVAVVMGHQSGNEDIHYYMMLPLTVYILVQGLAVHLIEYLSYKTRLRQAKLKYKKTNEKSVVDVSAGYSSLGAVGLYILLNIYGAFATCATLAL